MLKFFRSLFAWEDVKSDLSWRYQENRVTGRRRAITVNGGYACIDLDWLDEQSLYRGHPKIDGIPAWRTAIGQMDGRWTF